MATTEELKKLIDKLDHGRKDMVKLAYTPMAPPAPPATAMPPADPAAMPPGGPMPPGAPMPPGDPAMMAPPPADPNAMPPGAPPAGPEAGAPAPGGNPVPPELEGLLSELAQGMGGMSQAVESQQANLDALSERLLKIEEELSDVQDTSEQAREALKQPAGFEGEDEPAPADDSLRTPPEQQPEGQPGAPAPDLPLR